MTPKTGEDSSEDPFKSGTPVEVSRDTEGFGTFWCSATVVRHIRKKANKKRRLIVQFHTPKAGYDDNAGETVDLAHVRPVPPRESKRRFLVGEDVDALYGVDWREGVVESVNDEGAETTYSVFIRSSGKELLFKESELRLHRDWVDGEWVPPLKAETPPLEGKSRLLEDERIGSPSEMDIDKVFTEEDLPFERTVCLWNTIESMEVFKKMPQNPHFQPLEKVKERSYREGLALGLMVNFANLVETSSKLQPSDSISTINDMMKRVKELEEHGFDVKVIKDHIFEFVDLKDEEEKLVDEANDLNNEIVQHIDENTKIEKEMQEINEQIRKLQQKRKAAELAKVMTTEEVASLKVQLEKTEKRIKNLRRSFKGPLSNIVA